jgi:tetratricopeptide (TPR) repeat protein
MAVMTHLLERRVPQILGLYLGASWVTIEFVSLLVDRFALSPHLIEFSLVILGSLIPTALMLAYFHGKPGRNDWALLEKVGIPVNLLSAVVLVFFVFSDKHLGAATTRLVLENEEGGTVERVIPKSEFRKKLIAFNFDNRSGDPDLDWLQFGLNLALLIDVQQDLYISIGNYGRAQEELERAGYEEGVGVPVALQASVAEDLHQDFFAAGSFDYRDGEYTVTLTLYETRRRKVLSRHTYGGPDYLTLVDEMSRQLRYDLEIPERHIEETADLRIADLTTHSRKAYRLLILGVLEIVQNNDWPAAREILEAAAGADPTSVLAQWYLSSVYLILNQREEAERAVGLAMEHLYRLPESWQFDVKYSYYLNFESDAEKRLAVAKMKAELHPADIEAHVLLATEYQWRGERELAIEEYEHILELDPSQIDYLREIAYTYRGIGEFDEAFQYARSFVDAVPNDYRGFDLLGDLYAETGDHAQAKDQYEKALVLEPSNVRIMHDVATAEFNLGRFDESLRLHQQALSASRTPQERAASHWSLSYHFMTRGRLAEAIEHKELEWSEREEFEAPAMLIADNKLRSVGLWAQAGRRDEAFAIIREAEESLALPFSLLIPGAYLDLYVELGDVEAAESVYPQAVAGIDQMGMESYRSWLLAVRGEMHELRGEFDQALENYLDAVRLAPTDFVRYRAIGRCHRQLGQLAEAEEALKVNLGRTPFNPQTHYESGLVYEAMGDREQAVQHLNIALEVWKDADAGFEPAQNVRAKMAALEATTH